MRFNSGFPHCSVEILPLYINLSFPLGMSPVAVPTAPLLSHLRLCLNLLFPSPPSIASTVLFLFWFPGASHNPTPQWIGMFHHPSEFYPSYLPILNFCLASLCLSSIFPPLSLAPLTSNFCSQPFLSTPSSPFPLTLASVLLICVRPLLGIFSLFFCA